jgi:RNA polymerase sigma-70 factor (ECF subfamily)
MGMLGATRGNGGDPLEKWIDDGYPTAYRTAYLILHNRHDAEEAVQDALLRAWRFRAAVPDGDGIRPWMYRVVVNACLSKLRSERSARDHNTSIAEGESAVSSSDPERDAEISETQRAVIDAIASLPEHLRVVVVLRYYAGLSEREIGSVIHRRPGTVKSRIHEAKSRLGNNPLLSEFRPAVSAIADGSHHD